MGLANVCGVDADMVGGSTVIQVFVTRKLPESILAPSDIVPRTFRGYRTDVVEIGQPVIETTVPQADKERRGDGGLRG